MDPLPPSISIIETTADVGFEIREPDLPRLFETAALGLTFLTVDPGTIAETETERPAVESEGLDNLFVGWLNELIYLRDARGFIGKRFTVRFPSEGKLTAEIRGGILDPTSPARRIEVKAATRHRLHVEKSGEFYIARVIFDI
jgi:SHS2 domain-containing protein